MDLCRVIRILELNCGSYPRPQLPFLLHLEVFLYIGACEDGAVSFSSALHLSPWGQSLTEAELSW